MKRFPQMILVALLVHLAPSPAGAGQDFHGRVLDGQGKGLSGAVVSARSRSLNRTTTVYADEEGRYRLPELAAGSYDVRARHFGFKAPQGIQETSGMA